MQLPEDPEKLAEFLKRLPKQKPSEEFHARFWKAFEEARLRPASPRFAPAPAFTAVACLAALAWFGVWFAIKSPERPSAAVVYGDVSIAAPRSSATKALEPGGAIPARGRVTTGPNGWAILEFGDRYRVKVDPNTEFSVEGLRRSIFGGRTVFNLTKGQLFVSIGHETHRKYPVAVRTSNALASAMGTQFAVSQPGQGAISQIRVLDGMVRVESNRAGAVQNDSAVLIPAGHETRVAADQLPSPPVLISESLKRELEEQFQFGKINKVVLFIGMGPDRVRELLRPCAIYVRLHARMPEADTLRRIVRSVQEGTDRGSLDDHLMAAVELEAMLRRGTELDAVPLRLFLGAYYAYLKRFPDAVRVFEETAALAPDSGFAPLALMAAAVLYDEQLGNPQKAAVLAGAILSRYPQSAEAAAARALAESRI